jgi:hypothetical protein
VHALTFGMWTKIKRLFIIKNKFEAFAVIYALGLGSVERGVHYLQQYPGFGGWLLFSVCPIAVFMAGARILDSVERNRI